MHNKHDTISLLMHAAVKRELLANPECVIGIAKSNLQRWRSDYDEVPRWMNDWNEILDQGVSVIVKVLDGLDETSILLRSDTPFTGIITQEERNDIRARFTSCNGQ